MTSRLCKVYDLVSKFICKMCLRVYKLQNKLQYFAVSQIKMKVIIQVKFFFSSNERNHPKLDVSFMSMSVWTENMRTREVEHSNPQKCSIHLYGFPHCLTLNMVLPDEFDFTFAPILIKIIFGSLSNVFIVTFKNCSRVLMINCEWF